MNKKFRKLSFNHKELEELLKAVYTITRARIVILDDKFDRIAAYPEEHLKHCRIIREDDRAKMACRLCDWEGCRKCKDRKGPYVYKCHAGLYEVALPLMDGDIIIGYLMLGEVILYDKQDGTVKWKELYKNVENYEINISALRDCYVMEAPIMKEDSLLATAKLMETCASHLYLIQAIKLQEEDLAKRIEEYIMEHIRDTITVEDICGEFGIGRTKLYEIAGHSFGEGLAREIRRVRMREAERLLKNTDMKISTIAAETGYQDYNYFTKVFKREKGMTPREFRKLQEK